MTLGNDLAGLHEFLRQMGVPRLSDACVIDSTGIEIEAIVGRVLELMTARRLWP